MEIDLTYRDDGTIAEATLKQAGQEVKPHHEKKENVKIGILKQERVRITPYNEKGEIEGLLKEYDWRGQLRLAEMFVAGKREGLSLSIGRTGVTFSESHYKNDLLNGTMKFFDFDTKKTIQEIDYVNGKKDGSERYFFGDGRIWREMPYKNDKLDGVWRTFYDDGKPNTEIHYKDGERNGVYRLFWKNGNLADEFHYKEGKKEGIAKLYNENGLLEQEIPYRNDKVDGVVKYYENGKLKSKSLVKEGIVVEHNLKQTQRVSPQVRAEMEKKAQKQGRGR